jgi:hypothetical protein
VCEPVKKLFHRNDSDSIPPRHFDQVEVAFKIIVSGNQVLRFAADCRFQDLVVIGIAAYLQFACCLYDRREPRSIEQMPLRPGGDTETVVSIVVC